MLSKDLLDAINLLSFIIGLENLDLNIDQNDLQEQTAEIDRKVDKKMHEALNEIHLHLEIQDDKLNRILEWQKNEINRKVN